MPGERERHLVVAPIPAQTIAPVLAGERPGQFPLAGSLAEYSEWDLVSHSFEVCDDGKAILTAIFERSVRSGSGQQEEGSSSAAPREEHREQSKQERVQRKQERALRKQRRARPSSNQQGG